MIKPVTYYEAWCEHGERLELGDYTAMADSSHVVDILSDYDDYAVCADGRVYCSTHKPESVCPGTDNNEHVIKEGACDECQYELPVKDAPQLEATQ